MIQNKPRLIDATPLQEQFENLVKSYTGKWSGPVYLSALERIKKAQTVDAVPADRVAALETELAAAMAYISTMKDCETCKHEMQDADSCPCDCELCTGEPCAHMCQHCENGSRWEWRGARGTE